MSAETGFAAFSATEERWGRHSQGQWESAANGRCGLWMQSGKIQPQSKRAQLSRGRVYKCTRPKTVGNGLWNPPMGTHVATQCSNGGGRGSPVGCAVFSGVGSIDILGPWTWPVGWPGWWEWVSVSECPFSLNSAHFFLLFQRAILNKTTKLNGAFIWPVIPLDTKITEKSFLLTYRN